MFPVEPGTEIPELHEAGEIVGQGVRAQALIGATHVVLVDAERRSEGCKGDRNSHEQVQIELGLPAELVGDRMAAGR